MYLDKIKQALYGTSFEVDVLTRRFFLFKVTCCNTCVRNEPSINHRLEHREDERWDSFF